MNITLDSYHKDKVKKLDKKLIKNKKIKIEELENKIKKLDKKKDFEKTNEEIELKYELKLKIKELEEEISKYEVNEPKINYFLDTMDILEKYYTNKDQEENKEEVTIMDYITNKSKSENNLKKFVKGEKKTLRKKIFFEYLDKIDKSNKKGNLTYVKNYTFCDNCNIEKIIIYNESLYVCEKCGECTSAIIETEKTSYRDNIIESTNFSYKRYNHFLELTIIIIKNIEYGKKI